MAVRANKFVVGANSFAHLSNGCIYSANKLAIGANSFAHLSNGRIYRANKFAPTIELLGLNHLTILLVAKIQENFKALGI